MTHRRLRSTLAAATAACLVLVAAGAVNAQELTLEKVVAQVNGAAPADDLVEIVAGDTVVYDLLVTGSEDLAGTEVTVVDVFDANALAFDEPSSGGCAAGSEPGEVSCTVTLGDDATTTVSVAFSVLPIEGTECEELVNDATVTGDDGAEATAQTSVTVCPEGVTASPGSGSASAVPSASPEATGGTQGSTSGGGEDQPNTALPADGGSAGLAVQLGALLLGSSIIFALHRPIERRNGHVAHRRR